MNSSLLVVCRANLCRSPVAAALLKRHLEALGRKITITSAGVEAKTGLNCPKEVLAAASDIGINLGEHRSQKLDPAQFLETDLILCMSRRQVREVVSFEETSWPYTATIKQWVRLSSSSSDCAPASPRTAPSGNNIDVRVPNKLKPVRRRVEALLSSRQREELLGASAEDDVADPVGGPRRGYVTMVKELDLLTAEIARWLGCIDE